MKINNLNWRITFEEPDNPILNEDGFYLGLTVFNELKIYIRKGLPKGLTKTTVIHELCHAFLFSFGTQNDAYNEEQLCDIFGAHAEQIVQMADKIIAKEQLWT